MRRESLMFSGSVIASALFCGLAGISGLFIFGLVWLILGE